MKREPAAGSFYVQRGVDPEDKSSWPVAFDWLCDMALRLKEIALKYGR